ncbi:ASCH domain-containing protein [Aeromicrobium phragmitis]|uniref:ASCH domain-containing protein n=1 Tax=Aeromicrobium phragmitis TaxID=2478914 RepID=A0A3L8PLN7_9ACTN|nr:ASCH domain-containing protein [Aeromicrobium phragmitis]RLV55729.1 ASCH domain-containing protein [Aeromicrobium phragmitis]
MSLWRDYLAAHPDYASESPVVDQFGDSPELADALLELVLTGPKRATAGLATDGVPAVGTHWVMTDGAGRERAVLRTTEVRVGRLDSVDDQFAWDEGEGDRSRDDWLASHRRYFRRVIDPAMSDDDLDAVSVVFERFELVWPPTDR